MRQYCFLRWQVLSYYGHPSPWGPAGLQNASFRSGFVNGNRVWCSRMSDRLQAYSHVHVHVLTVTIYSFVLRHLLRLQVECNPILSCTQAATLCTKAATLCIQAEEWEDPWLSTIAPPGLGHTVPRPYDRGLFPVRYTYYTTTLAMTTRSMTVFTWALLLSRCASRSGGAGTM